MGTKTLVALSNYREEPRRLAHAPELACYRGRQPGDYIARSPRLVTCPGCRWLAERPKRERARQQAAARAARRAPPRPPYERSVPRVCALCGGPIPKGRHTWCSATCVDTWNLAANPDVAGYQLRALHGSRCWACWQPAGRLELDHRRPLWSLTDTERTQLRWWLPGNLQLLCVPCHAAKTAAEAAARGWHGTPCGHGLISPLRR